MVTSLDDEALGARLLYMRTPNRSARWLARCVERVTFEDYSTIQRELVLDIRLSGLADIPRLDSHYLLPLVRLPTGGHTTFFAYDEDGSELSRLTRQEERALVVAGLLAGARNVLAGGSVGATIVLPPALVECIRSIANHEIDPSHIRTQGRRGRALWDDPSFQDILVESYKSFYLVVLAPGKSLRRVLRLRYFEQASETRESLGTSPAKLTADDSARLQLAGLAVPNDGRGRRQQLWDRLAGAAGAAYQIDVGSRVAECESYHLEIRAPYDLRVIGACLYLEKGGDVTIVADDDSSTATAHMALNRLSAVNSAIAFARLVPVTTGIIRTSWLSACFIFVILLLGLITAVLRPNLLIGADASSATAVLLLAPAVLAAALARPSPHSMTTRLLFDARLSVIFVCLALFAAAISVSLKIGDLVVLRVIWGGALFSCLVVGLRLIVMRVRLAALIHRDRDGARSAVAPS